MAAVLNCQRTPARLAPAFGASFLAHPQNSTCSKTCQAPLASCKTADDSVAVEGFTSGWWLVQNGLGSVVGTMGADCSEEQAELIVSLVRSNGRVWIASDGDPAGERHAQTLLKLISPHRLVRWVKMEEGKQPTDLSAQELKLRLF